MRFASRPIQVYAKEVTLMVRFAQPPAASESTVKLTLSYQACDESACFPPVTKQVELRAPSIH